MAQGHAGSLGLLNPSLRLGLVVMDRFHLAVRHWSRAREFAADAAGGAGPTSPDAAARARLRSSAVQPRIAETLDAPGSAAVDLVAATLDHAIARGLDDPARHLGGLLVACVVSTAPPLVSDWQVRGNYPPP